MLEARGSFKELWQIHIKEFASNNIILPSKQKVIIEKNMSYNNITLLIDLVDLITAKPSARNKKRKLNGKEKFWLIFRYVSLAIIWFLVVMPIYVMVINSLKGVKNVYLVNAFKFPEKLDFSAWSVAWSVTDYFPQFISPRTPNRPYGSVANLINKKYGDYTSFKEEFIKKAMAIQGSGWIYMSRSGEIKTIKNHAILPRFAKHRCPPHSEPDYCLPFGLNYSRKD